jgi:hypothetical protein
MHIHELFEKDVTRDIPPVVYFHEQAPQRLREEVGEYIVTGGFPKGDPRAKRNEHGIHEGFVGLLTNIERELRKPNGPDLPASWISGFYGSGKSIFAKLLGMALDGALLDNGTPLSEALLRRDDSPRRQELVDAWNRLLDRIDPIAVVFDIGAVARDNEHIHSAALRQFQARLGYCTKSSLVAEWELRLERDGRWEEFLAAAEKTLGKPWSAAKEEEVAEDHFSHVLHVMQPDRYPAPMEWIDTHAGLEGSVGTAPIETIEAIDAMLSRRAVGKTLFLVIDEVSQYVHQDDNRMLKLQSFVSELGKRLKGRAWILATGQQKLEDTGDTIHIGKMKDRFPPKLRVHLAATNIRDVVHKRLLKKRADRESILRELFQTHRADLKLHGYSCQEITEEDFVEVYPMLPGQVELLLDITTELRTRSTRIQGDDHAIRGLLQLLGELFRTQELAQREVGELVTLDTIYEVQQTALDPDVQTALARIFTHPKFGDDLLAKRAAKAVALLQWIQDSQPTTAELVAKCLYSRLGQGNRTQAVSEALERLRAENLLGYSEKQGYKIQSSAGQEWERERRDVAVTLEKRIELVQEKLRELLGMPDRPRYKGNSFPWTAFFSDGRSEQDARILDARTGATVTVDFRFLTNKEERTPSGWVRSSDQNPLRDRIVWVVGDPGRITEIARELFQSRHMIKRYEGKRGSLPREKERLVFEEQSRGEELETRLRDAVAEAFHDGGVYFRGKQMKPSDFGGAFATALTEVAKRWLPDLFPHFTEIAVTDTELGQLLEKQLSGPSTKFMEDGLGILSLDAGKYVATCSGEVPRRVMSYLEGAGASGSTLVSHFSKPPFGYPADVIKACLAGLLRASKIRIRPEEGPEITSIQDPGSKDLFRKIKDLGRADVLPARETEVGPRDRVAICKFFEDYLDLRLDRENDAIADALFQQFPGRREALRNLETRLDRLPARPALPPALARLGKALEDCLRTRQVEEIVIACKHNLDALRDGLEQLALYQSELTDEVIEAVTGAARVRDHHLAQLETLKETGEVAIEARSVADHLKSDRPWRDIQALEPAIDAVRQRYAEVRRGIITQQSQEAEKARGRIQRREGFEKLDADQSHRVLRPIHEATTDTTEDALYPTLQELRDGFPARLAAAEELANDLLDEERFKETKTGVVKVPASLRGREVASRVELEALLGELNERIGPLLDQGKRVRIV